MDAIGVHLYFLGVNMKLPEKGFLRLPQIIGQAEVTKEQADQNKKEGNKPVRPRPFIPALVPVKKSTWWEGVKTGRFPKPTKAFGSRVAAWRVEDIYDLIDRFGNGEA